MKPRILTDSRYEDEGEDHSISLIGVGLEPAGQVVQAYGDSNMDDVNMTFRMDGGGKQVLTLEDLNFPKADSDEKPKGGYGVEYYRDPGLDDISYPETAWKSVRRGY